MKKQQKLPLFNSIDIAAFPQQLSSQLNDNLASIDNLLSSQKNYSWENLIAPLEEMNDKIDKVFSPIAHLNAVCNSSLLRESYQACLPLLSDYASSLGQNENLFLAIKSLLNNTEYPNLSAAQKKIIDNELLDFKLAGVSLDKKDQIRYQEIQKELSALQNKFENNLLDATDLWSKHIVDLNQLEGLPQHTIELAHEKAQAKNLDGYLLTIEGPCYLDVITYADSSKLREEIYYAYTTRASELGDDKLNNSLIIDQLLSLRHELALLLGYDNYAEVSLAKKMANSTNEVIQFLTDLALKSKNQAKQEFQELSDFAKEDHNIENLNPWDIAYYSEKLKQKTHDFSEEDLRPYFSQDKVLSGLFEIAHKLFNISLKPSKDVDTWHEDVLFFEIFNPQNELIGKIYCDLYAREKKRGGAWMDECIIRRKLQDGSIQLPVAFLTCNFNPPTNDRPALFSHNEVETLFHEFGHCLQHLLTKIDYAGVSGINGVEWDAVEVPSQFLENWCWHKESLSLFAEHYNTKEALPDNLFERMLNAKNFQSAMQMLRQIEFSLFDMKIHSEYSLENKINVQATLDKLREQIGVVPIASFNRFQHGFSHIFAGGYAAGYYSYKWAELLSADLFSLFEEQGIFSKNAGELFLKNILEVGGARPSIDSFIACRGRKPTIEPLLISLGIK